MADDIAQTGQSILNVFGLKSTLNDFGEIFYNIFLWTLFSCVLVHIIAAAIAFCRLRQHKIGRWMPVVIIVMGFLSPLTGGALSSAAIAGFYRGSDFTLEPEFAMCWGVGQTVVLVVVSFSRILPSI